MSEIEDNPTDRITVESQPARKLYHTQQFKTFVGMADAIVGIRDKQGSSHIWITSYFDKVGEKKDK